MKNNINLRKRLDIVVKYLFIKAYIENKDYDFYRNLYRKHISLQSGGIEDNKRSVNDFEASFIGLIKSMKKKWFDTNYPIVTNTAWDILSWAHRYACSLYLKIEPSLVLDNALEWIDWSYNWFTKNNFSQDELLNILWWYCDISNKYSLLIVWPNITEHPSSILPDTVGSIRIDMGKKQNFKELIYDMYSHDYGIDINIGAIEKANYLANTGTYIDIYIGYITWRLT